MRRSNFVKRWTQVPNVGVSLGLVNTGQKIWTYWTSVGQQAAANHQKLTPGTHIPSIRPVNWPCCAADRPSHPEASRCLSSVAIVRTSNTWKHEDLRSRFLSSRTGIVGEARQKWAAASGGRRRTASESCMRTPVVGDVA